MLNGEVVSGADVLLPLKMMNRHGLIAGATGTGKTKNVAAHCGRIRRDASACRCY